jgi:hypothetical protein
MAASLALRQLQQQRHKPYIWAALLVLIVLLASLLLLGLAVPYSQYRDLDVSNMPHHEHEDWRSWLKEHDVKVAAVVFFGRPKYVRVLHNYIRANLACHGGILQEVLWVVQTDVQEDVDWLHSVLLPSEPEAYRIVGTKGTWGDTPSFRTHYKKLEPDTYYVKLDDDIMFISDGAIKAMLAEKLRSNWLLVSANIINHSLLTHMHGRMAAVQGLVKVGKDFVPPKAGHHTFLEGTALQQADYNSPFSNCSWLDWQCAAMSHYNFFLNYEAGNLDAYDFKIYDFHAYAYDRWSINAFVFRGREVMNAKITDDDELSLSSVVPAKLKRHCAALGSAVVTHMAYKPQRKGGLEQLTNVLQRYEDLAERLGGPLLPCAAPSCLQG